MVQVALEDKPYRLWAGDEKNEALGLQCLFWPKCDFCGARMAFWCAKPHKFSINDGDDVPRSHAIDIELYCPLCGYWEAFGVAVSKEHYEHVVEWGKRQPHGNFYKVRKRY